MSEPLWAPSEQQIAEANMTTFMRASERAWGISLDDYAGLYEWSITKPEQFWQSLWTYLDVIGERPDDTIIKDRDSMIDARFFPAARLSFAENILRTRDDYPAIIFRGEDGSRREVTRRSLYDQVSRLAQALRGLGIAEGDRVAAILPNIPETLACMLAANSIGAIWTSCSLDFGVHGVRDRLGQVDAKLLFAVDRYSYKGKVHDTSSSLRELRRHLHSLEHVVMVPVTGEEPPRRAADTISLADFIEPYEARKIDFVRFPFEQPAFILYTSGTTGLPKCIVHRSGGVLLQLLKEHALHFDTKPGDRFFYFTTTGWNMWYTLVGALGAGATVMMYEGSPFYPGIDVLFEFIEAEMITAFGTSPKYLESLSKQNARPREARDLTSLKTILSTGAPLSPDSFDYVYREIKQDVRLSSISGGTEIMTTFANGNPIGPVWRGELQVRTLGMQVEIYDDEGQSIRRQKGELVCTAPFPSMPLGFWNDPGDARYHQTYFSRFPRVWCHGDFAELTAHGGMIIYGRSDATLNPGGIRIGTAEIYRPAEEFEEIADSLVVGQEWENDLRVVLFVKLRDGIELDDALRERIKRHIREFASPRHVPAKIIQVADIPYTVNGKKVELAVRNIIHGQPVKSTGSIVNPDALSAFEDLPELRI